MFLIMGFTHVIAGFFLFLNGSGETLVYSQLIGGLLEIAISLGNYFLTETEEFI